MTGGAAAQPPLPRFAGRRVLVTGAGSGIGRAVALRLAQEGARVAVSGRRREPLEETVAALYGIGGAGVVVAGDLAVEADAARVVADAADAMGGIDVLVNSAGSVRRGPSTHAIPVEVFDDQVASNLRSTFLATRAVLPHMLETAGDRCIVNIASTLAHTAGPGTASYVAAKGGVVAFTRAVAVEYASFGIRANCICPATIRTPMAYSDRADFDEQAPALEALYPLGRLGEPEDVAGAVAYLASEDARWVTGSILDVDGGLSAQ